MYVYLIRHGQTEGNVLGYHQGWGMSALTEKGKQQAGRLAEALKEKTFDRIISSDLHRTKQTCAILFGENNPKVCFDARLREINNTVLGQKTRREMLEKYGQDYVENCHKLDFSPYGGESPASILERTADFLSELQRDTKSENVAVVTHGGTIRAFLSNILKCPLYTPLIRIDNCSVTILHLYDGKWSVNGMNYITQKTTD